MTAPGGRIPAPRERISSWARSFGPSLLAVARAHAATEDDAREAVAEAWAIVLGKEDALPPDELAHGWLLGIVRNVARARRRQTRRRRHLAETHAADVGVRGPETQPPVEARLLTARLWRRISELPDLQREVLVARILDGLSTREVAQAIERSEGTVKTSLHRALKRLREEFGATLAEALAAVTVRETRETTR